MSVSKTLRKQVTQRARNRCEYCKLSQAGQEAIFHIDHIIPEMDGGQTILENLALACVSCSLRKGARQLAHDPTTRKLVRLSILASSNGLRIFGLRACASLV